MISSAAGWLSRDPAGEEAGLNLYAFVRNSPVNAHDPLGLAESCTSICWKVNESDPLSRERGGGVYCYKGQICPCVLGFGAWLPETLCPEFDEIIRKQESEHIAEVVPCDACRTVVYPPDFRPDVDRKASECAKYQQDYDAVKQLLANGGASSPTCHKKMEEFLVYEQKVMKQEGCRQKGAR